MKKKLNYFIKLDVSLFSQYHSVINIYQTLYAIHYHHDIFSSLFLKNYFKNKKVFFWKTIKI